MKKTSFFENISQTLVGFTSRFTTNLRPSQSDANLSVGCLANLPAGLFHSRCFAFNCVLVDEISSLFNSSLLHSKNSSSSDSSGRQIAGGTNEKNCHCRIHTPRVKEAHTQLQTCELSYLSPLHRQPPYYFEICARSLLAPFSSRYNSSSSARTKTCTLRQKQTPMGPRKNLRVVSYIKRYIKYIFGNIHVTCNF